MESQVAEAKQLAMEAFWESTKFFKSKVDFGFKAYTTGQRDCRRKVAEHCPNLDLTFLGEEEAEGEVEGHPAPIFSKAKGV